MLRLRPALVLAAGMSAGAVAAVISQPADVRLALASRRISPHLNASRSISQHLAVSRVLNAPRLPTTFPPHATRPITHLICEVAARPIRPP